MENPRPTRSRVRHTHTVETTRGRIGCARGVMGGPPQEAVPTRERTDSPVLAILRAWGAAVLRPYRHESSRIWTCQGFASIRRRARVMGRLNRRGPALPGFR